MPRTPRALPGSYYLGLYRMRTRGSALIGFVGRDAELIAAAAATAAARGTPTISLTAEGEPS